MTNKTDSKLILMSPRSIILVLLLLTTSAFSAPRQDSNAILDAVKMFLLHQSAGLRGTVELEVSPIALRLSLPDCAQLQPFTPDGATLWGDTSVGVRCVGALPWTIFLPVHIQVTGVYLAAAHPIKRGQILRPDDLVFREGDLTNLPSDVLNLQAQAVGREMVVSIADGEPLHREMLRTPEILESNRQLNLTSSGWGFNPGGELQAVSSLNFPPKSAFLNRE